MQIVYLGQSIQAAATLSTSWWATHTQSLSLSLSLRMSRLTSLFLGQKRYITMFEPNLTYSHCILSHAHRLSRSLSPTRLTLSIARPLCDRLTLPPPTHKIYLHVCDWIISQALSYIPHPCQKAHSDNISPEHIYLFNECRTTLTLSLYLYVSRLISLSYTVSSMR